MKWYNLDNTGTIYPSILSRRNTTLFRLSVSLKSPVQADRLNRTLAMVISRFPYYRVQVRRGAFWYTFVDNDRDPKVVIDSRSPCSYLPFKKRGVFPFRVRAYGNTLSVEFSHVLTDATGALVFLKTLLAEYFQSTLKKGSPEYFSLITEREADQNIFDPFDVPEDGEARDAFREHFDSSIPSPDQEKKVFHLSGSEISTGRYRVLTGELSVTETLDRAKQNSLSLTEYLVGIYFHSLQKIQERDNIGKRRGRWKPLSVMVPVNLRGLLKSTTMRNFFLTLNPLLDTRLDHYNLREIFAEVRTFMRTALDHRHLKQQIARNVRGRIHPLLRVAPLRVKDLALKLIYLDYGESRFSGSLSNIGKIDLPRLLRGHVERITFVPPPSPVLKVKCGVLTYGESLFITFGSLIEERDLELYFFSALRRDGLGVRIRGNYKGEE